MSSTPPQPPAASPEVQASPPPPVDVVGTGCTCLSWVAEHHGLDFSAAELRRGL
ncbi:hypothetical protein LDC_3102, partial [sediment metagenome]